MLNDNNKISSKHLFALFAALSFAPAIRIFPRQAAMALGSGGWMLPFAALMIIELYVMVIGQLFKNNPSADLHDIFSIVFGKTVSQIILNIYLLLAILLASVYLRLFAERVLSSAILNLSISWLFIYILGLIWYVSRKPLASLSRFAQLFLFCFAPLFLLVLLVSFSQVKVINLMPTFSVNYGTFMDGFLSLISTWGLGVFMLFFRKQVYDPQNIKRNTQKGFILLGTLSALLVTVVIGALGSSITERMTLPFFSMIKMTSILGFIDRFDAFIAALWIFIDFIFITYFVMLARHLTKTAWHIDNTVSMTTPICLVIFILGQILFNSNLEVLQFTDIFMPPIILTMLFVVPIITLIIGRLRKKI